VININIAINKPILLKKKIKYTVYKKYTAQLYLLVKGGRTLAKVCNV